MVIKQALLISCASLILGQGIAAATPVTLYSNLTVTNGMAAASHPPLSGSGVENEAADDFVLGGGALVSEIKFIGLLTSGSLISLGRTWSFTASSRTTARSPPDGRVPTRTNSPSDVAFDERGASDFSSVTVTTLAPSFTATNSVNNGIHPSPGQTTGGEGPVTGTSCFRRHSRLAVLPSSRSLLLRAAGRRDRRQLFLALSRAPVPFPPGTTIFRRGSATTTSIRTGCDRDGHRRRRNASDLQYGVRAGWNAGS